MITKITLLIALMSLCIYMYGVLETIIGQEENTCQMTFMYEYPQFVKVNVKSSKKFQKYNLYAYSEGVLTERVRLMQFDGAPVLFIPGNSGSYKQARSLASVALRKGIDNNWMQHLDYFTVDLNEEYTGLFGGFLDDQTEYVAQCVKTIMRLYQRHSNRPTSLIVIGHSMGGKIAQALLVSPDTASMVNTIITISSPMDAPVLAMDYYFQSFYDKVDDYWSQNRAVTRIITNKTNTCNSNGQIIVTDSKTNEKSLASEQKLNDKLLITIGGGSRDVMVRPELTKSKFDDIHAMTTSIPKVWLSTDHLSAVWCLQFVMVINKFLHSIIEPAKHYRHGQMFIEDKHIKYEKAKQFFEQKFVDKKTKEVSMLQNNDLGEWFEDIRRVFVVKYTKGFNRTRVQMIRLVDTPQYKFLKVEAINIDVDDWVFGCAAKEVKENMRFCSKAISITHLSKKHPSMRHERTSLMIDLHQLKRENPEWTHILIRTLPTNKPFQLNVDIHFPPDREVVVQMPEWYSFSKRVIVEDTLIESSMYYLKIKGLEDVHESLEVNLIPRSCSKASFHSVAKMCVPWTEGYTQYHYFNDRNYTPMYVNTPFKRPSGYNVSLNPIMVYFHLDPECRYSIHIKNSFGGTASQIVKQYTHWIPAHLVAIILLALKYQLSLTPPDEPFKCGSLYSALLKSSPFFLISASRLFVKFILWIKVLPKLDAYDVPILVMVIVHGSAMAVLILATTVVWASVCFCGNMVHKIIYKLVQVPMPTISSLLVPAIRRFPIIAGVLLISIAMASCGGIALICGCIVYYIVLSKMYEDYLENLIQNATKKIAQTLFGKEKSKESATSDNEDAKGSDIEPSDESPLSIVDPLTADEIKKAADESNQIEEANDSDEIEEEIRERITAARRAVETNQKGGLLKEMNDKEQLITRAEYDATPSELIQINFHLSLFFLFVILTLLNLPSVLTWAKNFNYSPILRPDPSLIPAIITLVTFSIIWQMSTPRNIIGYKALTSLLYGCAAACILYCQDSIYRLNGVICLVFVCVTLHQIIASKA